MARAPGAHGKQQFGIGAFVSARVAGVAADTPSGPGTPVIVTVDDPPPQQALKYVAAIAAVAISGFVSPPSAPARASVISAAWAPADPLPQRPNENTAPFAVAAQVDVPPGASVPKIVVLPDDPLPQVNAKLPQPGAGFVPFTRHLEVLGAWAPITFSLPAQAKIAPLAPAYPPPLKRSQDWTPWYDAVAVKLTVSCAATAAAAVTPADNPPFGLHRFTAWNWGPLVGYPGGGGEFITPADQAPVTRPWLDIIVRAWSPADPLPTLTKKLPQAGIAPAVDNPPGGGVPRVITVPDDPLPQVSRKLPQGAPPDLHDQPPFTQRRTQDWTHWFQPYPLPTLSVKAIQAGPPEVITPPPPTVEAGGTGFRVGRYKQLKLRKKLKRDECEELLVYLRSLPPAERQMEIEELASRPWIASLLEMMPAAAPVQTPAKPADDDDDDECIALLLQILNS